MNAFLASFPRETVVAVVIDGLALGALAFGAVLLATGVALLVRHRARRRAEQYAADHIQQLTSMMASAEYLLWEAEVELMPDRWDWQMRVYPSELYRRLIGEQGPPPSMRLWSQFAIADREEMDRRARRAIEMGAPGYTQEFKAARAGHVFWMREQVSILHLGGRRYRLVGFATDITAERQTPGEAAGELTTERILEHAQCLLWRATVIKNGDALRWAHFDIPQSQFSDLLFGDRVYSAERGFWENMELPDQAAMDTLATRSILDGAPAYTQQFRAINREGRLFWLNERVSITRVADTIWSLVGVLTDATAQREAEAARHQSEARLAYLLERSDCLVWEATVKLLPDETLQWSLYTQRSML
jgi:PAS domain-containing protein